MEELDQHWSQRLRERRVVLAARIRVWWMRIPTLGGTRAEVALFAATMLIVAICVLVSWCIRLAQII